ncbi:MAG: endonuclease Q family protein [Nanoarchaeota archaeon]
MQEHGTTQRAIRADLHIHSRFSQGTSKNLDLPTLEKWARIKGIDLLGTGDFTHPRWRQELKTQLEEDSFGTLRSANGFPFILQTEIAQVYTQDGKGRRVHNVLLAPDWESADNITAFLKSKGRVDYDGRPIFRISCPELVDAMTCINEDIEIIPAHIWTPWYGILGSRSGFSSLAEAFDDTLNHVHAIETGISSDPEMNRRLSQLDNIRLVSNSDLHSHWPWRMGREATLFDLDDIEYSQILKAIRTGKRFAGTLEADPAYGKYHWDGHRSCEHRSSPQMTIKQKGICPVCNKTMTLGVDSRVEMLADRNTPLMQEYDSFRRLLPLSELISIHTGRAKSTKTVWNIYNQLVNRERSELDVLLTTSYDRLKRLIDGHLLALIMKNRNGSIHIEPGYDGVYGTPQLNPS